MDLFEPTFGDTEAYKTLREFADAAVTGVQYLNIITRKSTDSVIDDLRENKNNRLFSNTASPEDTFKNAIAVFEEAYANDTSAGVINV